VFPNPLIAELLCTWPQQIGIGIDLVYVHLFKKKKWILNDLILVKKLIESKVILCLSALLSLIINLSFQNNSRIKNLNQTYYNELCIFIINFKRFKCETKHTERTKTYFE